MTFDELKTELGDRGFDYLEGRLDAFINQAYREICNLHSWPFLEEASVGTVPRTITDLRKVLWVQETVSGAPLRYTTRAELAADGLDLSTTGTADYWYIAADGTLTTFPLTSASISVIYTKRVAPMSADSDEPVFDEEYHPLIVDGAAIRAYLDTDNFAAAEATRTMLDRSLSAMGEDYLSPARESRYIEVVESYDG